MSVRKMQLQLDINANVGQAKAQIRSMQQALTDAITASNSSQLSITPQIQQAQQSALQLKIALQKATNVDTGKLNLQKFRTELQKSGMSIQQYAAQMKALGPEGVQAFARVSQAVQQADTRIFSLNAGLKKLATTFMNTMRWQVASSVLMGITSAAQETIQHMADLDKALTNISIVTGKSEQEMARFAKTAHAAAKELSVTALEYTEASLIYFQQGLSSKDVKERTDVTTKLAKVVGENAETVSEWMTAIWNNFDDGSVSLERYADTLAALGAATASSADEIAGGLEKFAAVAETVGLSFDYAAAALATITAETRQSEDVVGTALKTILARMENLKLGETLEDGTTLGQYSEALMKVGVSIKDSNGALKEMDTILDEVGMRWQTLTKDEQVALAQGVAGIRQYNQFIALMGNWDVMQKNVEISKNSLGTLESQFLIYTDSVEGAQARMKEAGERLKESFFTSEDMEGTYDFFTKTLGFVSELVEAFGGLKGILMMVAAGLMSLYQPQLTSFFSTLGSSLMLIAGGQTDQKRFQQTTRMANFALQGEAGAGEHTATVLDKELGLYELLEKKSKYLSDTERLRVNTTLELIANGREYLGILEQQASKAGSIAQQSNASGVREGLDQGKLNVWAEKNQTYGKVRTIQNDIDDTLVQGRNAPSLLGTKGFQTTMSGQLETLRTTLDDLVPEDQIKAELQEVMDALKAFSEVGQGDIEELAGAYERLKAKIQETAGTALSQVRNDLVSPDGQVGTAMSNMHTRDNAETLERNLSKVDTADASEGVQKEVKSLQDKAGALAAERRDINANIAAKKKEIQQRKAAGKSIDTEEKELKELEKKLVTNKTKTRELTIEVEKYGKALQKSAAPSKEAANAINMVEQQSQEAGMAMQGATNKANELDVVMDRLEAELAGTTMGGAQMFTTFVSGAAMAASGINMLSSSVENLVTALLSGEDGWETWLASGSAILMSFMMIIPVIGQMITIMRQAQIAKTLNLALQNAENEETKESIRLKMAEMGVEETKNKKGLKTIITNFGKMITNWPAGTFAAIGIAAILAGLGLAVSGAISSAKTKVDEEKAAEAKETNTEQAKNTFKETQEATKTRTSALEKYQDEFKKYRETGDNLDTLVTAAGELGTVFDDATLKALALSGQFKELNDRIAQLNKQQIEEELAKTKGTTATFLGNYQTTMVEGDGGYYGGGDDGKDYGLSVRSGSGKGEAALNSFLADSTNQEGLAAANIKMHNKGSSKGKGTDHRYILSDVDPNNPAEFLAAYDWVTKLVQHMQEEGVTSEDEMMADLLAWLAKSKDTYTDLKGSYEHQASLEAANLIQDNNLGDKKDLASYLEATNKMLSGTNDPYIKEALEAQFGKYAANSDFELARKAIAQQQQFLPDKEEGATLELNLNGTTVALTKSNLEKIYANATPAQIRALAGLDFSQYGSSEALELAYNEALEGAAKGQTHEIAAGYKVTAHEADTYTKILAAQNGELAKNKTLLEQVSGAHIRLQGELSEFQKVWKETNDNLLNGTGQSYAFALSKVSTAMGELLNTDSDLTAFVHNQKQLIADFMSGNVEAFEQIQKLASEFIIQQKSDFLPGLEGITDHLLTQNVGVGEALDLTSGAAKNTIDYINDALEKSYLSQEDVQEMFQGYTVSFVNGQISDIVNNGMPDLSSFFKDQKEKLEKDLKALEKEKDYYFQITQVLNEYNEQLEKISKKKDNAFGAKRLQYLREERAILEKTLEAKKEEQKIAREQLTIGRSKISQYGFQTNAEGYITNYDEVYDRREKWYKQKLKDTVGTDEYDDIKEEWKEFTETYEDYNKRLEKLNQTETDILDAEQKILDSRYEEIEYEITFKTRINDYDLQRLDFLLEGIEDDAYAAAEAVELLGEKAQIFQDNFSSNMNGIKGILGQYLDEAGVEAFLAGDTSLLDGIELREQDVAALENYTNNLYDNAKNMKDAFGSMFEALRGVFDETMAEFDKIDKTIQHSQSMVESYQNIIDLLGKGNLGVSDEVIKQIRTSQEELAGAAIDAAQARLKKAQADKAALIEQLNDPTLDEATKEAIEKEIEYIEEQIPQIEESVNSALIDGLNLLAENRNKAIEEALNDFVKDLTGFKNLDDMQQAYDRQKQLNDLYVDSYEKIYQLSKLSRQLDKSINDTSNLKAKKQLAALEEKITAAKAENVKLSSYELSNLEREYQLELAKIALEDAQNAKSTVRLHRNSSGGMSYVYTADEGNIDTAQQKYEDAVHNMQKANDDWMRSSEEGFMQATATYYEQMQTINTTTYDSEEERQEAMKALNEWYMEQCKFYLGQIDIVLANNADMYANHVITMKGYYGNNTDNFVAMCEQLKVSGDIFIDDFDKTFIGGLRGGLIGDSEGSALQAYTLLKTRVGSSENDTGLLGAMNKAQADFTNKTEGYMNRIGVSLNGENGDGGANGEFKTFVDDVSEYLVGKDGKSGLKSVLETINGKIVELANHTKFSKTLDAISGFVKNEDWLKLQDQARITAGYISQILQNQNAIDANKARAEAQLAQDNNVKGLKAWLYGTTANEQTAVWSEDDANRMATLGLDAPTTAAGASDWFVNNRGNVTSEGRVQGLDHIKFDTALGYDDGAGGTEYFTDPQDKEGQYTNPVEAFDEFTKANKADPTNDPDKGGHRAIVATGTTINDYSGTDNVEAAKLGDGHTYKIIRMNEFNVGEYLNNGAEYNNMNSAEAALSSIYGDKYDTDKDPTKRGYVALDKSKDNYSYHVVDINDMPSGFTTTYPVLTDGDKNKVESGTYLRFYDSSGSPTGMTSTWKVTAFNNKTGKFTIDKTTWDGNGEYSGKTWTYKQMKAYLTGTQIGNENTKKEKAMMDKREKPGKSFTIEKWRNGVSDAYSSHGYSEVGEERPTELFKFNGYHAETGSESTSGWKVYGAADLKVRPTKTNPSRFWISGGTWAVDGPGNKAGGAYIGWDSFAKLFNDDYTGNPYRGLINAGKDTSAQGKGGFWDKIFLKFDTGGYTGEWGPEGRLAMLHQKEIILNAHDTENILQVVDMVRQMADNLDLTGLSLNRGLNGLLANIALNAAPQQIDQNVHITAEFPNVTDRNEIQAAFGDLVNLAAQYANRR